MHRTRVPLLFLTTVVLLLATAETSLAKLDTADLWSTINICDTKNHPNKLGVRARMPNDGHKSHTLWMKFIAQYKSGTTWKNLPGITPKFEKLGDGKPAWRSSGTTFTIKFKSTDPKGTHFTFRGLVKYQWRDSNNNVVLRKQRTTTGGHPSMNADPPGYSAATCVVTK